MTVKRIVTNIAAKDVSAAHAFYHGLLGLEVLMDQGLWTVKLPSRLVSSVARLEARTQDMLGIFKYERRELATLETNP